MKCAYLELGSNLQFQINCTQLYVLGPQRACLGKKQSRKD